MGSDGLAETEKKRSQTPQPRTSVCWGPGFDSRLGRLRFFFLFMPKLCFPFSLSPLPSPSFPSAPSTTFRLERTSSLLPHWFLKAQYLCMYLPAWSTEPYQQLLSPLQDPILLHTSMSNSSMVYTSDSNLKPSWRVEDWGMVSRHWLSCNDENILMRNELCKWFKMSANIIAKLVGICMYKPANILPAKELGKKNQCKTAAQHVKSKIKERKENTHQKTNNFNVREGRFVHATWEMSLEWRWSQFMAQSNYSDWATQYTNVIIAVQRARVVAQPQAVGPQNPRMLRAGSISCVIESRYLGTTSCPG